MLPNWYCSISNDSIWSKMKKNQLCNSFNGLSIYVAMPTMPTARLNDKKFHTHTLKSKSFKTNFTLFFIYTFSS